MKADITEIKRPARHALLIDDDEVTNFINKELILELGAAEHVIAFDNAPDALEFIKNDAEKDLAPLDGQKDIIFLDINMPGMDGYGFLERYQKMNLKNKAILIIMLGTQLDDEGKKRIKSMKSFVSWFIEKPLVRENIIRIVNDYI